MGLKDTESNYRQNKIFMESMNTKDATKSAHSDFGDLSKLILHTNDDRLAKLPTNKQIIGRANALYLEQLSHREVVERLVQEGYDRDLVVTLIRNYASQRHIQGNVTAPLIFLVVCIVVFIWAQWPVDYPIAGTYDYRVMQIRTLKMLITVVTMVAIPALGLVVLYHHYDQVPALANLLEPFFQKHRTAQADVVTVDQAFTSGALTETDYETALIKVMGRKRGAKHFRFMRNQKHFGLE
jgi:hypothetical protein